MKYLNQGLCEDLLINLQDGTLDLFIRETEWSQENSCTSESQDLFLKIFYFFT